MEMDLVIDNVVVFVDLDIVMFDVEMDDGGI